jgi:SAM-dependent methyltransferase
MKDTERLNCTICGSSHAEELLSLNCATIDSSALYQNVRIHTCGNCGHIYNQLSHMDKQGLIQYYQHEYAPVNMASHHNKDNQSGTNIQFSTPWYAQLYTLMKPFVNPKDRVLDVGCAMGGYLNYLHQQGFDSLFGVDIVNLYVDYADKDAPFTIQTGNAESIPFDSLFFDCLVMDQVMEHLIEPRKAFIEARRVLRPGGILSIAVPDANRYKECFFFDFYWFILREHIQHFDIEHLKWLGATEGFELVCQERSNVPMMSESMILPNLNTVFRRSDDLRTTDVKNEYFDLRETIKDYIAEDSQRLNSKRELIEQIKKSQKLIYIWGIGREFLYLYEEAGLKQCNISALIDNNSYKQIHVTVGGKSIFAPSILEGAASDSALLITAVAHKNVIMKALDVIKYKGQIIAF